MESLFAQEPIVTIRLPDITSWCERAKETPRKRFRLCAHQPTDTVHEMIICLNQATYIRPHKHLGKSESIHVIAGHAQLLLFDDQGGITQSLALGPFGSGRTFFHRSAEPLYHTLWLENESFVFHETTNGPHDPSQTLYAPWSPPEGSDQAQEYRGHLAQLLRRLSPAQPEACPTEQIY